MSHRELKKLIELLQPKKQFPYGIHVLRCFILWSKFTSSVGLNLGFLATQGETTSADESSLGYDTAKNRRISFLISQSLLNQSMVTNMLRTAGTGALSANAQQQAKFFFDFQHLNSVMIE